MVTPCPTAEVSSSPAEADGQGVLIYAGIDEAAVDRALHARVPGGAEVWHWLPQTDAGKPSETSRAIIRAALGAARMEMASEATFNG